MELVGKTLGNYRIDRTLGEGGMGVVYQAHDLSLQRDVAIKVIHEHFGRRPNLRERFLQEARVMAHLDHPGIVKVFTVSTMDNLLYIVMEYIPGHNLHQLLEDLKKKNKWLPLPEALQVVEQLCSTLEYAHRQKVLHRDIKPSNLMIKREPVQGVPFRVILTDLGLAKLLEGEGLTEERAAVGTPAYMSPEQAAGQATDARSDVYSLGVLLYELTVGRPPFPVRSLSEAVRSHTRESPPRPRSLRPELPQALEQVILKALEKDPRNRYANAAGLGAMLANISSTSTELNQPNGGQGNSLITVYEQSVAAPPSPAKPRGGNPKTILDDGMVPPRGDSIFGGKSIPPSPETRIQIVSRGKPPQMVTLPAGTATIGRGPSNDIPLSDPKASQRHAQVTWDGLEYYVTDLNSTNGTYLANTKLLAGIPEVWQMNQNLRIGDTWLRLIRPTTVNPPTGSAMLSKMAASALFKSAGPGLVGVIINPQQLKVDAGGTVTGSLSLLNQGPKVDHFSLSMSGIPGSWIATLPSNVQLMPGNQTETVFVLRVPRLPQSKAGQHPITLRVTSQSDPSQFVEARLVLTIAPYIQFTTELEPPRLKVGKKARLTISNQGNEAQNFTIEMKDREEALDFRVTPRELSIREGQAGVAEIQAAPRKPTLFGGETIYPITAEVATRNADPQIQPGEVVARALLPRWVLVVVPFLCILLGLLGMNLYGNIQEARQTQTATALTATASDLQLTATATWFLADDDRDGLTNEQELNEFQTDPRNRDTDEDGLSDGEEVKDHGTKPLLPDTDRDGLRDGDEVSRGLDPLKTDTDNDGLLDNVDPAPAFTPTPIPSATPLPSLTPIPTTAVSPITIVPPTTVAPTTPAPPTPYVNDFERGASLEWSQNKTTRSPTGRNFLGDFSNETVRLTLFNLPPHSTVKLNVDLYIIRSWDGNDTSAPGVGPDVWTLDVPGIRTLLRTTFCNLDSCDQAYPDLFGGQAKHPLRTEADEINTLGFTYNNQLTDTVYNLSFTFSHSGSSLALDFSASGLQGIIDESWGLDNIEVTFE